MSFADVLDVLYEDNHLIAVNKPCGWPSTTSAGTRRPWTGWSRRTSRRSTASRGRCSWASSTGSTSRCPGCSCSPAPARGRPGSASSSATTWSKRSTGPSSRTRSPRPPAGTLEDWLRKDPVAGVVEVVPPDDRGGQAGGLALRDEGRARRADVARNPAADRANTPVTGPTRVPRPADLRGPQVRLAAVARARDRPARPVADVPAPGPEEPITLTAEVPKAWRGRFAYLLEAGRVRQNYGESPGRRPGRRLYHPRRRPSHREPAMRTLSVLALFAVGLVAVRRRQGQEEGAEPGRTPARPATWT